MNAMGQGHEPIVGVFNRGNGTYPIKNHLATFERKDSLYQYNSYITNYLLRKNQVDDFDASMNMSLTYEDPFGNRQTNIGPNIGEIEDSQPSTTPEHTLDGTETIDEEL